MPRSTGHHRWALRVALLSSLGSGAVASVVLAQGPVRQEEASLAPEKVDVGAVEDDEAIRKRLQGVMAATGWFTDAKVRVEAGVVFLSGRTERDDLKKWAGDLARNTQDVAAVVNQIAVSKPSAWDFRETRDELGDVWRDFVGSLPFVVFGLLILALSAGAGWLARRGALSFLRPRIQARLLRGVVAGGLGVLVFLAGTYVVLRVAGLTQLALTIVGGTGLVGLAVGIAFRDITENFLASIFLSMQRPFAKGDLIEVAGETGYVRQLNVRTTVLMGLDGNLVEVPNAAVYKSSIRNFTINPNRREDFVVGIGYDDSIDQAQEIVRRLLFDHPAVLKDPEPWVLADGLGKATVNLKVYFWLDGRQHSWLKVRSSVIRLVKRAFQQHGISMPDEAREVVFPQGVPVTMLEGKQGREAPAERAPAPSPAAEDQAAVSTKAEGGLSSEAGDLEKQARQATPLQETDDLLAANGT